MQHSYRSFYLVLFLVSTVFGLRAQDARFAQFYAAPLQMNPALTGVYEGQLRLTTNYRELYTSILGGTDAFRTISAGIDIRRPVQNGDFFGIGLTALRDQAGDSRFTRTQAALSGSFLKQLGGGGYRGGSNYLVGGAQIGVAQRGFDVNKLWFSEQFFVDPSGRQAYIDRSLSSNESFPAQSTDMYLDVAAGLMWYSVFDENASLYAGGAIFHLTEPNISFTGNMDEVLNRKYIGQLGGELPLAGGFSLLPAAAVMIQGPAFSTSLGTNLRYTERNWHEVALRAGAWVHLSNRLDKTAVDAVVISTVLETERLQVGLSYDITVSSLALSNNSRGAFELSLIYIQPASYRSRVNCPKF